MIFAFFKKTQKFIFYAKTFLNLTSFICMKLILLDRHVNCLLLFYNHTNKADILLKIEFVFH